MSRVKPIPPPRTNLTVPEVAAELRVSRASVYRMVAAGEIPALRIGRTVRIPAAAFREWQAAQSVSAS